MYPRLMKKSKKTNNNYNKNQKRSIYKNIYVSKHYKPMYVA